MTAIADDPSSDGSLGEGTDSAVVLPEVDLAPDVSESPEAAVVLPFPVAQTPSLVAASAGPALMSTPSLDEPVVTPGESAAPLVVEQVTLAASVMAPAVPAALSAESVSASPGVIGVVPVSLLSSPGPELLALIASLDPLLCSGREVLDGIAGLDRVLSWVTGVQQLWFSAAATAGVVVDRDDAVALAQARNDVDLDVVAGNDAGAAELMVQEQVVFLAAQEIAPLLNLAQISARGRVARAHDVVLNVPMVHRAVLAGSLNPYRAWLIASGTAGMSPTTRLLAAQILLDQGGKLSNSQLTGLIKKTMARLDRAAFNALGEQARNSRGFGVIADEHGMARVWAVLPADQAVLIKGVIHELADHHYRLQQDSVLRRGGPLWRTKSQLRADAFADIILTLATTGVVDLRPFLTATSQPARTAEATPDPADPAGPRTPDPADPAGPRTPDPADPAGPLTPAADPPGAAAGDVAAPQPPAPTAADTEKHAAADTEKHAVADTEKRAEIDVDCADAAPVAAEAEECTDTEEHADSHDAGPVEVDDDAAADFTAVADAIPVADGAGDDPADRGGR